MIIAYFYYQMVHSVVKSYSLLLLQLVVRIFTADL